MWHKKNPQITPQAKIALSLSPSLLLIQGNESGEEH